MGGGSPDVHVPEPTQEERDLQREQTEVLRQQRDILLEQQRISQLLNPILFKQSGFNPITDDSGRIIGFEEDPNDPALITQQLEQRIAEATLEDLPLRRQVEKGLLQRSLAALRGDLPVNPALTNDLTRAENELHSRLLDQLGPGYETSTPGIEALAEFNKRKIELIEGARRDDLTLAEQLGAASALRAEQRANTLGAARSGSLAAVLGINQTPLQTGQGFARVAAGYQAPLSNFFNQRQLQANVALQNARNSIAYGAGPFGNAILGAASTAAGVYAGTKLSDIRLKKNIRAIGRNLTRGLTLYVFEYIGCVGRYIGYMADEVELVVPEAVIEINGYKAVNYGAL